MLLVPFLSLFTKCAFLNSQMKQQLFGLLSQSGTRLTAFHDRSRDVFAGIVECNASILHLKLFFSLQNALYKAKVKNYCFFRSHLSASRNNIWEQ